MMNVLTAFLLCFAAACAVPVPPEKTVIYKYYANVKTGIIEPAQYASQFDLAGELHIKKDVSDPTLNNAYYVKLQNIKHGLFNGMVTYHQPIEAILEPKEETRSIQDPFLIIYDENGKFQGVKIPDTDDGWSRNIKQGIASMLQLDLSRIQFETPMKPHSFITTENTIHGTCQVAYDVHSKDPVHSETTNMFTVTKFHNLQNCSHFIQRVFDHMECEKCHMEHVDDMTTSAKRVFQVEKQANDILIKHLFAQSTINYFPYNARSEFHYLLTNMSLSLDSVVPVTETNLPTVNFEGVPLIRDITFNKPLRNYALHAAEDLTHGRRTIKMEMLIPKLQKMLIEAADYLDENHLEAKEPDWKHGQTINRLQYIMSYMDLTSLEQVYDMIQDAKTMKEVTMKNIFLRMISTVGTTATCHFTRNVIRKHKVTDLIAISMLVKLPMHVKVPSERLLLEMEDLLKLDSVVPLPVRKASILCFSILIRKTFMHHHGIVNNSLLEKYLHRFLVHVKNDQSYDMKMLYLMAIKNVQIGNIEKLLEPIIRGEVLISDHPHHFRTQAIWAIKKAVAEKVDYTHDLLWPIFSDVTQPLPMRIVAYDVLMNQLPNMKRMMNIYWHMVTEQNNHLYNYHLTNLKGLANSVDPCLTPIREMTRMIIRSTRIRPTTSVLSSKKFFDYTDPIYGHGESFNNALILDELTGLPHVGYLEHYVSIARKPVDKLGIYWSAYGLDDIIKTFKRNMFGTIIENLTNKNVKDTLNRAAQDMPMRKHVHIELCITLNGHVIMAHHYDQSTFKNLLDELMQLQQIVMESKINHQDIMYDTYYEMQVPTDMGMQAVFSTKKPRLISMRFNNILTETKKPSINLKLDMDTRVWRHGEYVMSVYNPIADVWHSVRKTTAQDVALPIDMNLVYNHETKNLKITMPRLPVTKLSHTGILNYAKSLVTITEDEHDMLKKCCFTCKHHTVVTTGEKKNHFVGTDSKDLGLKYGMTIFDCENGMTPVSNMAEWYRALSPEHKNTWNSKYMQYIMGICQKLTNDYISPEIGTCGMLMNIKPSIVYPTSQIDINVRINMENVDHIHDKMHALNSKKINIRGTLDAKAASTNESVCLWDMNMNIDMSQGHVTNSLKTQIMRTTPGEKNLKICIDAQKNYPEVEIDIMKFDDAKEETNAKMIITAGFTDDDKCVRDEMLITMTVKGEMSEEQKKQIAHNSAHGDCVKDIQTLQLQNRHNYIPKTTNCIREVIQSTTMRKYVINTSYKKVPVQIFSYVNMIEDYIRATHLSHLKYITDRAESGNAKITLEFPFHLTHIDASIVTPSSGYEYIQIPLNEPLFEGMTMEKAVPHIGWHMLMDNTRFPSTFLGKWTKSLSKLCMIYPQTLITLDNGMMPFVLPDQWVLLSGDHIDQTYAIFVKSMQDNKIAVRMYVADHEVEIIPNDFNAFVTVDGNVIAQHEKGVVVPADELDSYAFKLTQLNDHLIIQSRRVPVILLYIPNSVTVEFDTTLQGHVTGLCGHMDDTHKEKIPKSYTVAQF